MFGDVDTLSLSLSQERTKFRHLPLELTCCVLRTARLQFFHRYSYVFVFGGNINVYKWTGFSSSLL